MIRRYKAFLLVVLFVSALAMGPASGRAEPSFELQLDSLQQQIDQLREQASPQKSTQTQAANPAVSDLLSTITPASSWAPPEGCFEPCPGTAVPACPVPPATPAKTYPDYKLTGFFQLDMAYFAQSAASRATLGDIQDGAGFRRARLAAAGNVSDRASYLMEFDMAQAQARFVDVWGQIQDTPLGNVRIGRFRQPFGMTELTSVRELAFLERPTPFALAPFRQTGVMFFDTAMEESVTWAAAGFRTISDNFGNVYGDDGGYGTAERVTTLLVDGGDASIVHLGLGHSYLDPARNQLLIASQDEVFIGQQPNLGPTGLSVLPIVNVPPFVNSGVFAVNDANLLNVEMAASLGHALIQSEYRWSVLNLPTGQEVTVHGGYATLRYVLTGETIPYNRAAGVFGRITPNHTLDAAQGHWGAWEVAARISTIDLNPLFGQPGVPGPTRRLVSMDLGLNWYMWKNAKCQLNWVNGSLSDPALGGSVSNTVAARAQFDF
jgi:phosphate-selective porin OprO/OprP